MARDEWCPVHWTYCRDDCAWFCPNSNECAVLQIASGFEDGIIAANVCVEASKDGSDEE